MVTVNMVVNTRNMLARKIACIAADMGITLKQLLCYLFAQLAIIRIHIRYAR